MVYLQYGGRSAPVGVQGAEGVIHLLNLMKRRTNEGNRLGRVIR